MTALYSFASDPRIEEFNSKSAKYPFPTIEHMSGPRIPSRAVDLRGYSDEFGDFVRYPFPDRGYVLWSFKDATSLLNFVTRFDLRDARVSQKEIEVPEKVTGWKGPPRKGVKPRDANLFASRPRNLAIGDDNG